MELLQEYFVLCQLQGHPWVGLFEIFQFGQHLRNLRVDVLGLVLLFLLPYAFSLGQTGIGNPKLTQPIGIHLRVSAISPTFLLGLSCRHRHKVATERWQHFLLDTRPRKIFGLVTDKSGKVQTVGTSLHGHGEHLPNETVLEMNAVLPLTRTGQRHLPA